MLVKGEKFLTLNRGDERVQISGIVRAIDISPDNRVLSTRVATAHIRYVGKGEIARASRQGWLQRFFSIITPFCQGIGSDPSSDPVHPFRPAAPLPLLPGPPPLPA